MLPLLILALAAPLGVEVRLLGGSRHETLTTEVAPPLVRTRYALGVGVRYGAAFADQNRVGASASLFLLTPGNVEAHVGGFYERALWQKDRSTAFAGVSAAATLWNGINSDVGQPWGLAAGAEIGWAFELGEALQLIVRGEALARIYFDGHPVRLFPVIGAGLRFQAAALRRSAVLQRAEAASPAPGRSAAAASPQPRRSRRRAPSR